jgi:hypothetical protein
LAWVQERYELPLVTAVAYELDPQRPAEVLDERIETSLGCQSVW